MFKQSPSRNNRSKGIKVKHILQICVLLAVCIWLIYQVKHSHEKRREFEAKDEKVVGKVQTDSEIHRFGRKDIPRITEIDTDGDKHDEDEDEKEEEEENKHEEDELDREDVRIVERDEEREGGDDEIDEHEPEKTETESEHEEDAVDEDKEREEKEGVTEENEDAHEEGHPEREEDAGQEGHTEPEEHDDVDKENHSEQEVASDDKDHDVGRTNTREAQEVLYRADDASSEVTHNVQSVVLETENVTSGRGNEMWGKISFGQEHENKTFDNAEELIKPEVQPSEDINNGTSNVIITEPNNNEVNLIKSDDSSLQNSTLPELTSNSTAVGIEHSATLLSIGTQLAHDSNLSQNGTVEVFGDKEPDLPGNVLEQGVKLKLATDEDNQQEASADANTTEIVNTYNGESLSSHNATLASSHFTNDKDEEEAAKDSSVVYKNQGNKSGNSGEAGSDESSESHSDEGIDGVQHDPIDASDTTSLIQEEREANTDLDTLPEIKTETQNTEDSVAE